MSHEANQIMKILSQTWFFSLNMIVNKHTRELFINIHITISPGNGANIYDIIQVMCNNKFRHITLSLHHNNIGNQGAAKIARALKTNSTIMM